MTHEPEHTWMGTSKRNSEQSEEASEARSEEPVAGSVGGEPGAGGAGGHGDVVDSVGRRRDKRSFPGSVDRDDGGTVFHFGVDGDFVCVNRPRSSSTTQSVNVPPVSIAHT